MAISVNPAAPAGYAELFCQSNFSFLTGASHPQELVTQACELGYQALALTDECSVAGIVRAYRQIREHQLKLKFITGSLMRLNQECQFVLLCPNRAAYAEMCRVITNARRRSNKGNYKLDKWDILSLKACLLIWLPMHGARDLHWGKWLQQHHKDRVWIGVQRHLSDGDEAYMAHCQHLSEQLYCPITACGGVLMHCAERLPLQQTLTAIRLQTSVAQLGAARLSNAERALRPLNKLTRLFPQAWLQESLRIASLCQFDLGSLCYEYPKELVPKGYDANSYLRFLVQKGKQRRFPDGISKEIEEIIEKELALIAELNYPFFFLTIHDIVMFAKRQKILYQGRGSAANSVVCYCLEITAVDPRQISVLFERFLSKERNEPPDIDVDFEHERREEIIQYIYQKYGRQRAALAASVISYRFKSALRDVGKALGLERAQIDFFLQNINRRDKQHSWVEQLSELGLQPDSPIGQQLVQLVSEISGFPRHLSQHVGGFVIAAGPLYELVAVENAAMAQRTIIQWDKDDLETLKLLKVDILALGMLSALQKCFALVEQRRHQSLSIADITRLQDDASVYAMLQQSDSVGVFQIESRAQMTMLPRLKPRCYYDLVIQIAIVRPGPIQGDMVHPFLRRRDGLETVHYPSQTVREVLERTLGVPIFQEQVIKLAMVAAGFSGGEADQLRRAMASWKQAGALAPFRSKLINGMLQRGYPRDFAEQLFEQICGFAGYGFPESHSASFAVLAYCSAWLKYYYPAEFYTALLNSQPMGFYSTSQLIQDARRHHIEVLPVCINASGAEHQVKYRTNAEPAIRLGLNLVKNLSRHGITSILHARPAQGYQDMQQIKALPLNHKDLDALASSNALHYLKGDRFNSRWALMDSIHDLPLFASQPTKSSYCLPAASELQNMLEDYQSLGVTLNKHPITLLDEAGQLPHFVRASELAAINNKSLVTVVGLVTGRQSPGTAAGVTFFTLEDDTGNISVVVWQATAQAQKQAYLSARLLSVKGIVEKESGVIHVIAGRLIDLTPAIANLAITSRDFH